MSVPVARTVQELAALERAYVWSVNSAVQAGSTELADELAAAYCAETGGSDELTEVAA